MASSSESAAAKSPSLPLVLIGCAVALGVLAGVLWIWSANAAASNNKMFVAAPEASFAALAALMEQPELWAATGRTVIAWLLGFAVGGALGLMLGVIAGSSRAAGTVLGPTLVLVGAFPAPLLATLFILWTGLDNTGGAIAAAALIAFASVAAIATYAQRNGEATTRWQGLLRALEVGAVLALGAVVFTEMIASKASLGAMAMMAFNSFDTPKIFASVVYLWGLGVLAALPFAVARWVVGRR